MPETDVVAPGLDWEAYHKRSKPPPLRYWDFDKNTFAASTASAVATKKNKYSRRTNPKRVRRLDPLCRYCMEAPSTTADHVLPKSRGGSNKLVNLVGCCQPCNGRKADRTPKEAGMKLHLPLRFFEYQTKEYEHDK